MDATGQIFQISKFPEVLSFVIIPRIFWRNLTEISIYLTNSLKVVVFLPKSNARFKLVKVRKELAPRQEIISPHETANQ